jgi:hypothetical protein
MLRDRSSCRSCSRGRRCPASTIAAERVAKSLRVAFVTCRTSFDARLAVYRVSGTRISLGAAFSIAIGRNGEYRGRVYNEVKQRLHVLRVVHTPRPSVPTVPELERAT